jgi:hypothetical protein
MTRRGLQLLLAVLGAVAIIFGALGVLTGAASVLRGGDVSASVDSEMRFFAAWYVGGGLFMLRAARRIDAEAATIHVICAVWFVAACSRVLSILAVGSPHPLFLALMVVEFAIPLVVVPWHAAVSRRGERTRRLEGMT